MHFNRHTVDRLRRLMQDERFAFFFNNVKDKPDDKETQLLIDELANIATIEFGLPWEDIDKVRYFLWLGYHARK